MIRVFIRLGLFVLLAGGFAFGGEIKPRAPVPPHDEFWKSPASLEAPDLIFLCAFNPRQAKAEETLDTFGAGDELDDMGLDGLDGPGLGDRMSREKAIQGRLEGDAAKAKAGRFAEGVRLGGNGWVLLDKADLNGAYSVHEGLTLDFWIKPDAEATSGALACFGDPAAQGARLWYANGKIQLRLGDKVVLDHPRPCPPGTWTNIALSLTGTGAHLRRAALRVNGTPLVENKARSLLALLETALRIGGAPGSPGFRGVVDEVRLRAGEPFIYEWQGWAFTDPGKERPLADQPPFFQRCGEPYAWWSFDGTLQPETFSGMKANGKANASCFVPGVRGQAFDMSSIGRGAAFAGVGFNALPKEQGTLEFWIRPKNWNNFYLGDYHGRGVKGMKLMRLAAAKTPHYLSGFRSVNLSLGRAGKVASIKPFFGIHPGTWTHVVITWEQGKTRIYIDAEPQAAPQFSFRSLSGPADKKEYEAWNKRTGGKPDGTYALRLIPSATLIDELRVYDWPLAPEEVDNAYARYFPDAETRLVKLPEVKALYTYFAHSWDLVKKLKIELACLPAEGVAPTSVSVRLLDKPGGEALWEAADVELDKNGRGAVTAEREFDFGTHQLVYTSKSAEGKTLATVEIPYERVEPAWYGNTLGEERTVPKPWTPIAVNDRTMSVWGRTVELAPGGLPRQIVSAGRELFVSPPRIRATVGGRETELTGTGAVEFTETAEDLVRWQGTLQGDGLGANVSAWMEFDGLIHYTIRLEAGGEQAKIEQLQVDFHFDAAVAGQLICNGAGKNFRRSYDIRMIPEGEGRVWTTLSKKGMQLGVKQGSFCPTIWVGGDHAGIGFHGENDKGWTPVDDVPAQEIRRREDAVVYRMNVICEPVVLETERTFTFILHPTPTRPLPVGCRAWNRGPRGKPNAQFDCIDDFVGFSMKNAEGRGLSFAVEPHSWEIAAEMHADIQEKFGEENPVFCYIDYSWPRPGESFKDWNHDLWAGTGRIAWIPEWEDYLVWTMNEYLERGLIDGIYFDDTSMGRTYSLASTAYRYPPSENGRRVGFNTMGFRRFCKRMYRLFQKKGKPCHILPHMTWCFEIPAFSFCTSTVNGEDRDIHAYSKTDAVDRWSVDELRIMGNAKKWGWYTFFKNCTYGPKNTPNPPAYYYKWEYRQLRAMHANFVPHDFWFLWHNADAGLQANFRQFDLTDPKLRYVSYWDLKDELVLDGGAPPEILPCLFIKEKQALVVISNLTKKPRTLTAAADPQRIFGRGGAVAWRDVDCKPEPPYGEDMILPGKKKEKSLPDEGLSLDDGEGLGLDDPLGDAGGLTLERQETPQEKMKKLLEIETDGARITFTIRPRDYRVFVLERE